MSDGLWPALLQVQGDLGGIRKDAQGNGYRFASLTAVLDAARPALHRAGLVLTQDTTARPELGLVEVLTHLVHAATGERTTTTVAVAPSGPTRKDGTAILSEPQQIGVAITYGRRYGILCALGLATEDSDGAAPADRPPRQDPQPDAPPATPDAALAPRLAALAALASRIGSRDEVTRRLGVIAAGDDGDDANAPRRTRLAVALAGEPTAWRALPDAAFAAMIECMSDWPEGL